MSSDAIAKIADESKKITDSDENSPSMFGKFFEFIFSSISHGIFKSPPFSLENFFPSVDIFKNKYFKLVSIVGIYLGSIVFILSAFKPKNTRNMFLIYSVCFWIATMAFAIVIVNPYDENSVEYMLRNKEIPKSTYNSSNVKLPSPSRSSSPPKSSSSSSSSGSLIWFYLILAGGTGAFIGIIYLFVWYLEQRQLKQIEKEQSKNPDLVVAGKR